eukprot:Em0080g4a
MKVIFGCLEGQQRRKALWSCASEINMMPFVVNIGRQMTLKLFVDNLDSIICDQKQLFDRFCVEQFKDRDEKTSKTISREKGQRIVNVIKKDPSALTYSSQFKFWVKKKRFELINHPALGVKDVLCLPAKTQISKLYECIPKSAVDKFVQLLNTTVHGNMKTTPYELVFDQSPQQGIYPGVKGPSIMEEDVEDIIKEDEKVNVLQDQSLGKGQEDIMVDIEQWHPLENTAGDNGQLEERCSDGDKMMT